MKRIDGRSRNQLRDIKVLRDFQKSSSGSVLIEFGRTRVLCSANVVEDIPPWMKYQKVKGGWLTAEYQMLPGATTERSKREIGHTGGRTHEIQRLVGRSLRSSIDMQKLGTRTIYIDCDVIDADGGTRCASVTGGMIALKLALKKLIANGKLDEDPTNGFVAAVSVGIVGGEIMLDLCYEEDSRADVDMNLVMNDKGGIIEIQGTSEKKPFSASELDKLFTTGSSAIKKLIKIQKDSVC